MESKQNNNLTLAELYKKYCAITRNQDPDAELSTTDIVITALIYICAIIFACILYNGHYKVYITTFGRLAMSVVGFIGGIAGGKIGNWLGIKCPFIFKPIANKLGMSDSGIFWHIGPPIIGLVIGALVCASLVFARYQ